MPLSKVFEIHTIREGAWKIDSIFDNRELALMEAGRVEHGCRYPELRVVEETFDDETQKGNARTIYRSPKENVIDFPRALRQSGGAGNRYASWPPMSQAVDTLTRLVFRTMLLGMIIGAGLGLTYFLNIIWD